jgi:hypothetical protein
VVCSYSVHNLKIYSCLDFAGNHISREKKEKRYISKNCIDTGVVCNSSF